MLLLDVYKVPIGVSLDVIALLITVSVAASLRATGEKPAVEEQEKEGVER